MVEMTPQEMFRLLFPFKIGDIVERGRGGSFDRGEVVATFQEPRYPFSPAKFFVKWSVRGISCWEKGSSLRGVRSTTASVVYPCGVRIGRMLKGRGVSMLVESRRAYETYSALVGYGLDVPLVRLRDGSNSPSAFVSVAGSETCA